LAVAAGIRPQNDEERDRQGNDAGDDDQQERAAKSLSFLGRRGGGGGHVCWMQDVKFVNFLLGDERVFFRGFLRKHGVWMRFFAGVIVVECAVNVVTKHHQNRPLKIRHILAIYVFDFDSAVR
jgi:hypothetical protein